MASVGDPAPAWTAVNQDGATVTAPESYVLWFYPKVMVSLLSTLLAGSVATS